jgi:DNA-binding GntR family transcriptional regulator
MRSGFGNHVGGSKADRVRADLEIRFELGLYKFGEELNVTQLVEEYGVSRQPVMAALSELRNDGFVVITPQVGCTAANPTGSEIADFFSVFAKMDGRMASLAAARRTPEEVHQLRHVLKQLASSSGRSGQWATGHLGMLVSQYHEIIRHMAKSPAVAARVARFWRMANYIIRNARENYTERMHSLANNERRKILEAIEAGDARAAESLMEKHILGKPQRVGLVPPGEETKFWQASRHPVASIERRPTRLHSAARIEGRRAVRNRTRSPAGER